MLDRSHLSCPHGPLRRGLAVTAFTTIAAACSPAPQPEAAKTEAGGRNPAPPSEHPAPAVQPPPASAAKFHKGEIAPPGLSSEDLAGYNAAQGDPHPTMFTLDEAFAGDPALADARAGRLTAHFSTNMGDFDCELYEDKAPVTVANFVGLARGVRPSLNRKKDTWTAKRFYDGVLFHRVVEGFMIQTGDPTASGTGGPGYLIVDELDSSLRHKSPGMLSMANRGPNTGNSQFFITVAATPHLDGKHTIFGKCDPKVPIAISKVKTSVKQNNLPVRPVSIKTIEIVRK